MTRARQRPATPAFQDARKQVMWWMEREHWTWVQISPLPLSSCATSRKLYSSNSVSRDAGLH